ncbi:uncharacterized protein AAG666_003033 isoform 3-T5 [Megaptera novaeangliae]
MFPRADIDMSAGCVPSGASSSIHLRVCSSFYLPSSAQRPLHLHATQNFSTRTRSQVSSGKDNATGDHHLHRPPRHLLGFACDTAGNASHSTPFLSRARYHTKSNQSCS